MTEDNEDQLFGVKPDLLDGYDEAPTGFARVLQDGERRLKLAGYESTWPPRIRTVQVHVQTMLQYDDPAEKTRITEAANEILAETLDKAKEKAEPETTRFDEALAALKEEERRAFVMIIDANCFTLVYWNWRYEYQVATDKGRMLKKLAHDIRYKKVARPERAERVYGQAAKIR